MSLPERAFFFRGKEYRTPEELAAAFLEGDESWNDAMFVVGKGFVQKWLEYNGDFGRAAEMEKNAGKSAEEQCVLFASQFAVPATPDATYSDIGPKEVQPDECPPGPERSGDKVPETVRGTDAETSDTEPGDATAPALRREDAEDGNADAQFKRGMLYANAEEESRDDRQAVEWYRKAALQGHADAQFALGWMYANGRGVPQDDSLAIEWYRRAVQQGQPNALYNLGRMYENGHALRQNFVKAYRLYFRASLHGITEADAAMLDLKKKTWLRRPKVSEAEAARIEQEEGYRPRED